MTHTRSRQLIAALVTAGLLCAPFFVRAEEPVTTLDPVFSVIISEIGWSGSTLSTADEWIELTNLTEQAVDISGWTLTGAGTSGTSLLLPSESVIEPQSTFLIANYDSANEKSTLNVPVDYVTTSVSLSNSSLLIELRDSMGAAVDKVASAGAPLGGNGTAMVRAIPILSGDMAEAWTAATTANGFDEGALEIGTPGSVEEAWFTTDVMESATEEGTETLPPEPELPEVEIVTGELIEEPVEPIEQSLEESVPPVETQDETLPSPVPTLSFPSQTLLINELVSDPVTGEAEWIEIYNPHNNVIDLTGWKIEEGSGSQTDLPAQLIGWDQYLVIENPSGRLNNDGDSVFLFDPSGYIIDSVTYGETVPAAADPNSLARTTEGSWLITTTPTRAAVNEFPRLEVIEEVVSEESEPVEEVVPSEPIPLPPILEVDPVVAGVQDSAETVTPPAVSIRFSELYPNTSGNDLEEEFIELENTGEETVQLEGIVIEDASLKQFVFSSLTVDAGAFLLLPRAQTRITLNNDGDTVRILRTDGTLLDEVTYEIAPSGSSFSRVNETWQWTTDLTPDEPNTISPDAGPVSVESSNTTSSSGSSDSAPLGLMSISAVLGLADETSIEVSGVVNAEPGVLGKQIMYIADGTGIQIYKHNADFPMLSVGDLVTVTGTLSTNRGERRIKVSSQDTVEVIGTSTYEPIEVDLENMNGSFASNLIRTSGRVQKRSGNTIVLEQNTATLEVRLQESSGIDATLFPLGSDVRVTGIVQSTSTGVRLLPRFQEDIEALTSETIAEPVARTGKEQAQHGQQSIAQMLVGATTIGLAGLFIKKYYPHLKSLYAKYRPLRIAVETRR